jgi:hypothetical protein
MMVEFFTNVKVVEDPGVSISLPVMMSRLLSK